MRSVDDPDFLAEVQKRYGARAQPISTAPWPLRLKLVIKQVFHPLGVHHYAVKARMIDGRLVDLGVWCIFCPPEDDRLIE